MLVPTYGICDLCGDKMESAFDRAAEDGILF